jgi:predicted PurR-regulated permease PerM
MGESYALALVAIAIAVASIATAYWIVPELIREGHQLYTQVSGEIGWLRNRLGLSDPAGSGSGLGLGLSPSRLAAPLQTAVGMSLSLIAGAVVIVVTAIYLAANPELYIRGVLHLFPFQRRPRLREVMLHVGRTLRYWVLGQLVDMLVVGVLSGAGMALLGVPTPFALGVLSGLLTFVPYFGAILAGIPAGLVALTVSWETALWTIGVYTLCHCIEGYVIAPLVQRRFVDLPPALTVASMTIAGSLFGLLGLALGTPLAATGLVAVRMLYVEDALGDHTVHEGGLASSDPDAA